MPDTKRIDFELLTTREFIKLVLDGEITTETLVVCPGCNGESARPHKHTSNCDDWGDCPGDSSFDDDFNPEPPRICGQVTGKHPPCSTCNQAGMLKVGDLKIKLS